MFSQDNNVNSNNNYNQNQNSNNYNTNSKKSSLKINNDKKKMISYLITSLELMSLSTSKDLLDYQKQKIKYLDLFIFLIQEISTFSYLKVAIKSILNGNTITNILTASFIENIRTFLQCSNQLNITQLSQNSSHQSSNSNINIQNEKKINYFLYQMTLYCRYILYIYDIYVKLSQYIGIESGLFCFELYQQKYNTNHDLNNYMNCQRIHTCHNYIISYSNYEMYHTLQKNKNYYCFYKNEINSNELYHTLFSQIHHHHHYPHSHQTTIESKTNIPDISGEKLHTSILGDYQPFQDINKRIQSLKFTYLNWWWDALWAKDWNLLRTMLFDICQEEFSETIEYFIVELIRYHCPLDIINYLIRYVFQLFIILFFSLFFLKLIFVYYFYSFH